MKMDKICLSTVMKDLYGKNFYYLYFKVNKEYWMYCDSTMTIGHLYGSGYYKIRITYLRSGCMFYIFSDYPDIPEEYCSTQCYLASTLIIAELNPRKDLSQKFNDKVYYFDDKLTVVEDWDNSHTVDPNQIESLDIQDYLLLKVWAKRKS